MTTRLLDLLPTPVLTLNRADTGDQTNVLAATIRHGTGSPFGVTPSTATIETTGAAPFVDVTNGKWDAWVGPTSAVRDLIRTLAGLSGTVQPSMSGRVDSLKVNDSHTTARTFSTFDLADNLSVLESSSTTPINVASNESLPVSINKFSAWSLIPDASGVSFVTADTLMRQRPATGRTFADLLGIIADHGGQVHNIPGGYRYTSHRSRLVARNQWVGAPVRYLSRDHVLSPVQWSQTSGMGLGTLITYISSTGTTVTTAHQIGRFDRPARGRQVDSTAFINADFETYVRPAALAVSHHDAGYIPAIRSVTIPVRAILEDGSAADRQAVARLLIEAVPNHILGLGTDWPAAVRAPYFVTSAVHTVTPDDWRLTLTLAHHHTVVGP